jgi:hypothetical protein
MRALRKSSVRSVLVVLGLLFFPPPFRAELSKDVNDRLANAKYVYISSARKGGALGKPAEIWFLYVDDAIYVGTRPTSWRVRRIKAGRPQAKIWVGEPDGPSRYTATEREIQHLPSFAARGELVKDAKLEEKMFEVFARKYTDGWSDHEDSFRNGFKDGSRVMVKYTPVD